MSDLRERIAAVLKAADSRAYGDPFQVEPSSYDDLADAVIADLGLEEERTYGDMMRRHVTDWEDEK